MNVSNNLTTDRETAVSPKQGLKARKIVVISLICLILIALAGTIFFMSRKKASGDSDAPHIYLNGSAYWYANVTVTSLPSNYESAGKISGYGKGNLEGNGVIPVGNKVYTTSRSTNYVLVKNISTYAKGKTVKAYDVYELYATKNVAFNSLIFYDNLYTEAKNSNYDKKGFSYVGVIKSHDENSAQTVNIATDLSDAAGSKVYQNSDKTVLYMEKPDGRIFYFKAA